MKKIKLFALLFIFLWGWVALSEAQELNAMARVTQDKVSKPWIFGFGFKDGLYKANLAVNGRDISGLIFIKKQENSYRVVMLSELGLKYFDIEFISGEVPSVQLHYINDLLNKGNIIYGIKNSLALIFPQYTDDVLENNFKDIKSGMTIATLDAADKKKRYYYFLQTGKIEQIIKYKAINQKTLASFSNYGVDSPGKISITYGKVNWDLVRIEK